jgi:hypothetical protein
MIFEYPYGLGTYSGVWKNTQRFYGGYYPLAIDNYWHTGLHIGGYLCYEDEETKRPLPVKPIAPGKIIAFRTAMVEINPTEIFDLLYKRLGQDIYPKLPWQTVECEADKTPGRNNVRSEYDILTSYFDRDHTYYKRNKTRIRDEEKEVVVNFIAKISTSFVLIEHEIPYVKKESAPIKFYSLYMHLSAFTENTTSDTALIPGALRRDALRPGENSLNRLKVVIPSEPIDVDTGTILGYPGNILFQKHICHMEIFSKDSRILNLIDHVDLKMINIYETGIYEVQGAVPCKDPSRKLTSGNRIEYKGISVEGGQVYIKFKDTGGPNEYEVKKEHISHKGYEDRRSGAGAGNEAAGDKIIHHTPLAWDGFTVYDSNRCRCDQRDIIDLLDIDYSGYDGRQKDGVLDLVEIELLRYKPERYDKLAKMIIQVKSQWDEAYNEDYIKEAYKDYSPKGMPERIRKFENPQMVFKKGVRIPGLENSAKYYFFHPGAFVNNLRSTNAPGWKLTHDGILVKGMSGYLVDENNLYILQDGRRVEEKDIKYRTGGQETDLRIGQEDVWAGLAETLGLKGETPEKKDSYNTGELLIKYGHTMPLVVYQAFQINTCYTQKEYDVIRINDHALFYSIGRDETGIPIVVTQIGTDGPNKKKLVIAGPHGDERNAQRLIMATQWYFIDTRPPDDDTVLYFIPCLSPTMCFADARGIPVVDKDGKPLPLAEAKGRITIPYLHHLIEQIIPSADGRKLLRTLIQDYNGTAFNSIGDYNDEIVNEDYPRYGIDTNRDIRKSLESTQRFDAFISSLTAVTGPENIKVIMVHGYELGGKIYGTYTVNKGKVDMALGGEDFAKTIHRALFRSEFKKFYRDTQEAPLTYAGEWNQILYKEHDKIISVDLELPKEFFDEGRRQDPDNNNRYDPMKVQETFNGVLAPGKDSFQSVLRKISKEM